GLLFNAYALGAGERRSSSVLMLFFFYSSGTTMVASLVISMRLLAEERQTGSAALLLSAPLKEWEIIAGKFLSAWIFLAIVTVATVYMPMLIFVNGSVTAGQIVAGYLGLLLLGATAIAIGTLGSTLAPNQIVATLLSSGMLVLLLVLWWVGSITAPPLSTISVYAALYPKHFPPFMSGVISTANVLYYASATYLFLQLAVRALEARRWY
ncbi:MAG TPA: ABC transporter permease subunit, partial [Myxococcaceae bacterium]|nr:ABC transporter permease subunit [Myxococcaceae bacterium]